MNRFIILTLFTVIIKLAHAQDGYVDYNLNGPPSPNASSLINYASSPVSLYTGTAVINVPITSLEGRGCSIPISLSYHGSGIKVQEIASWVGLGWTLNAGGVVSRVVRGKPDESPYGYSSGGGYMAGSPISQNYFYDVSRGFYDSEPDLFYFNFMGKTGKFVLNASGSAVQMPYSNLQITPIIAGQLIGKWTFIDSEGVNYIFGGDVSSIENSEVKRTSNGALVQKSYTSSWYLSKIEYPNGEIVNFSYGSGTTINYKYFSQRLKTMTFNGYNSQCYTDTPTTEDNSTAVTVISPKYLSQISSSLGNISFVKSSTLREDLSNANYLDQINVYDYNGSLSGSFKFNYSYFLSDGCTTELCKRLKLDNIDQLAGNFKSRIGSFEYNSLNLPARDAHTIDHWGYYNNNSFSSKIPSVVSSDPCGGNYSGANREADTTRTKSSVLTKVSFPTGGYREYTYYANTYYSDSNPDIGYKYAGGVRIGRITEFSGNSPSKTTCFYYNKIGTTNSSGKLTALPSYFYINSSFNEYYEPTPGLRLKRAGGRYLIINSQSQLDLFDQNGSHVVYENVRVKDLDNNGYTDNYFTSVGDHSDEAPESFFYKSGVTNNPLSVDDYPYTPRTSKSWERGILWKQNVFTKDNKLIQCNLFDYKFNMPEISRVIAYKVGMNFYDGDASAANWIYAVGKYYSVSKPIVLEKSTSISYDVSTPVGDLTKYFSTVTEYTYDPITMLPTQQITYNGSQPASKLITKMKYVSNYVYNQQVPVDCTQELNDCNANCAAEPDSQVRSYCYQECANRSCEDNPGSPPPGPETAAIIKLSAEHKLSTPVEILYLSEESGNQKLNSATTYRYLEQGAPGYHVRPVEILEIKKNLPGTGNGSYIDAYVDQNTGEFELDPRMRITQQFTEFDLTTGNLKRSTDIGGQTRSLEWTEKDSKIKKQIVNPLATNAQTIEYSYLPLIGVTSISDPNQQKSYFEYDKMNRLYMVKDNDGSIVRRLRYNLKLDDNSIKGQISVTVLPQSKMVILKSTSYGEVSGITRYVWDFGDGQVQDMVGPTNIHTYATTGSYTIKLSKVNAEYGSVTAIQQVFIP